MTLALHILVAAIGLALCFGGVYMKGVGRLFAGGFTGLLLGVFGCALAIAYGDFLFGGLELLKSNSALSWGIAAGCGALFAVGYIFAEKAFAAISGFFAGLELVLLVTLVTMNIAGRASGAPADGDLMKGIAAFSAVLGMVAGIYLARLSVGIHDYLLAAKSAVVGSIGAVAAMGAMLTGRELLSMAGWLTESGELPGVIPAMICALILMFAGFFVQLAEVRRARKAEEHEEKEKRHFIGERK